MKELKEKIVNEKKIREGNDEAFIESVKISLNKFKQEMNGEIKERKDNVDKLISLLEIACAKIDEKNSE